MVSVRKEREKHLENVVNVIEKLRGFCLLEETNIGYLAYLNWLNGYDTMENETIEFHLTFDFGSYKNVFAFWFLRKEFGYIGADYIDQEGQAPEFIKWFEFRSRDTRKPNIFSLNVEANTWYQNCDRLIRCYYNSPIVTLNILVNDDGYRSY